MTILDALKQLRDDLKLWCINNFNNKLNKNLGTEESGKFLTVDDEGEITSVDIGATATELGYLSGATSNVQEQLDGKAASSHTHTVSNISDLTATATELNYVDGVTSNIQEQLDGKANKADTLAGYGITDAASKAYVDDLIEGLTPEGTVDASVVQASLNEHTDNTNNPHGVTLEQLGVTATADELNYVDGATSNIQTQLDAKLPKNLSVSDMPSVNWSDSEKYGILKFMNTDELAEYGINAGDIFISRAEVDYASEAYKATTDEDDNNIVNTYETKTDASAKLDEAKEYADGVASGKADSSHTHTVSNISDLTVTATELNCVFGVTSNIQNQLFGKANTSHSHAIADVTNLQTTLDGKAASSHNHSASDITSGTLSSDRLPTVPIANGGTGATTAADVLTNLGIAATATELNYVDGVTSSIQTQLDAKLNSSDAITNDEIDEICSFAISTYLNTISAEGVSF